MLEKTYAMVRFEYYQSPHNAHWYWRLKDGNNRTVADGSEGYSTKEAVLRAIQNVIDDIKRM
jgi:uncharacterized protein YegP (UPF0339 family)